MPVIGQGEAFQGALVELGGLKDSFRKENLYGARKKTNDVPALRAFRFDGMKM
jgi:hypothetical protein